MKTAYLSVLIPAHNEEETIEHVLRRVVELGSILKEVIVVDDGSTDRTATIVDLVAVQQSLVRLFRLPRNQGKTAAIRRCLKRLPEKSSLFRMPTSNMTPPKSLPVIEPILLGQADVVYGSRFLVRRRARTLYSPTILPTSSSHSFLTSLRIGI